MTGTADAGARTPRAEQRRQRILDAARSLFIDSGFHRTGMAQIAERSGVKVGQIYRDFANKGEIIAAICEQDLIVWLDEETLAAALKSEDIPALRAWLHRFTSSIPPRDQGRLMAEITAEAGRNEQAANMIRAIEGRVNANMSKALDALSPALRGSERRQEIINIAMAIRLGVMVQMVVSPAGGTNGFEFAAKWISQAINEEPV